MPFREICSCGILLLLAAWANCSSAQNALVDLPVAPSGFSRASSIYAAPQSRPTAGLSISATLAASYDSNVTQGSGAAGEPAEGDFVISPGGRVSYVSEGDRVLYGAALGGAYDQYGDLSEYSGLAYDFSAFGGYNGGKLIATAVATVGKDHGANRFYGDVIEQMLYSSRAILRYAISPKTSLVGNLSFNTAITDQAEYNDTTAVNAGLAALWSASPLMDVGPGFRYGLRIADNEPDVTTLGPNLNLNYQLSTKVSLRSTAGVDFVSRDGDSSDTLANWALRLNYQASQLWGLNFSLYRDSQANPSIGGGLDEVTAYRLGYARRVRRAMLRLGVGYETRSSEGGAGAGEQDFDYFTVESSLSMPVFTENADLTFSINYRDLSSGESSDSWDGIQTGLGLSWKF